ncbi:ATP-binding protein [Rippkaea orientalis]|uniref:ATP-binding protein n=1 Tax=Rippkaea orientalis TaxID=2546366 RepID=UPI00193E9B53|nr:ATP-binding protein [Rippkaea orientalis]
MLDLIDEKANNIEIEFISLNHLNEQATTIRLEPVGEEGEGVEFWLQREDIREYHQVKRQNTKGRWTLADLETKQILTNFKKKLENNQTHCYFISINNAYQLEELAERARSSQSWIEFVREFLDAKDWRESFHDLVKYWYKYQQLEIEQAIEDFKSGKLSHQQQAIINVAENSYEKLKRIYVETISERKLRQTVVDNIKRLIESKSNDFPSHTDYQTAVDILAGFALDSIHKILTASDIWKHLDTRGYQRCNYSKNYHVLAAIDKANQLYLSPLEKQTVIAGQSIPRQEAEEAFNLLVNTQNKKGVFLMGEAGVGKSGVMLQIAKKLEQENITFFVFRIDNLPPEVNPDDVGRKYRLPLSPTIILANISKYSQKQTVLIIDQLDAVSQVSGRNPQFFDCIHSLLEQTKQFSKVRVLVACRKFDLDNDSRIKNLIGKQGILETVEIQRLSSEQVKQTVQNLGLDASKLNQKQVDLLSLPLHLGLLAQISQDSTINNLNFETANDLFDKFWEFKQTKLYGDEKTKHLVQWNEVIDKICDNISTKLNQTLSISKYLLDDYLIDTRIMISENVLIQEQDKIKFFHENFFDYAFARRFTAREKQLLSFLREDEQHLFKRAQVRQILQFERSINFNQYLYDIEELLNSKLLTSEDDRKQLLNSEDIRIRFHLKQLVISLLSNLENPAEEEWEIIHLFLTDNESSLFNHAWGILYQPQWFMLAKDLGIIEQWLRDDNDLIVDKTVRLISSTASQLPDEVSPLIEPFIENSSEKWLDRFLYIADRISFELDKSRKLLDLFLTLLNKEKLDNLRDTLAMNGDFWTLIFSISEKNSAWTCEIIGHYLNRRLELYLMQIWLLHWIYQCCLNIHPSFLKQYTQLTIRLNPFDTYSYNLKQDKATIPDTQHTEIFLKSADKAPKDYVINVLPFMLSVIELTSIKDDEKPYEDNVWYYRSYGGGHGIESAIFKGMEIALSNLARNNPEEFTQIIDKYNLLSSGSETIQFLLIRAYTANGFKFVDEIVEYLCDKPYRLETGYSGVSDNSLSARFWASRQLIKAILPYCSQNHLDKLEQLILTYGSFNNDWPKYHPQIIINLNYKHAKFLDVQLISHYPEIIVYLAIYDYYKELKELLYISRNWLRRKREYPQFIILDGINDILIEQFVKLVLIKFNLIQNIFSFSRLLFLNTKFFIPSQRLTQRFFELQRKFMSLGWIKASESIKPTPIGEIASVVSSPIPKNATEKMTDEQWLEAIKTYDCEHENKMGDLIGEAYELSDNLEKEVKKDPYRFAKLIDQFPDNTNLYYFNAILRGIAETEVEIEMETVLNVCQRCHQLPHKPCGREISQTVTKLAYLPWDEIGFDIITYYALHDPNPDKEWQPFQVINGDQSLANDIYIKGINSVRGRAVEAIAHLIFKDKERTVYFKEALQQMVKDPFLAVRSCVAHALIAVLNYDRDLAINLFKELVDTEDILLSTQTINRFLYYALGTHYTDLKPIVERMINSQIPEVQEVGARSLFLVSLINSEAQLLAENYLSGKLSTPAHRKAAAFIYINNLRQADHREFCEQKLIQLFNDTNQEVQEQAAGFFSNLEPQDLTNYPKMIEAFINSSVFVKKSFHLLHLFTTIDKFDKQLAFKVCQRFVNVFLLESPNRNGGYSNQLQYVSQIIIQIYSQTRDSKLQSSCLDVIDNLYRYMVDELNQATQEYDR